MILDSSAIIAILRAEPEAQGFARAVISAEARRVSAVSYVESAAVIDSGKNAVASRRFDEFFRVSRIAVEAVTLGRQKLHGKPTAISARGATRRASI